MVKSLKVKRTAATVVVADASRMECELLAKVLGRGPWRCEVVASATEGLEVVLATMAHKPNVVLIGQDLEDGPLTGFSIVSGLRMCRPQPRIVMLLDASEPEPVLAAFRAGARGVFCKAESVEALGKCIHSVQQG